MVQIEVVVDGQKYISESSDEKLEKVSQRFYDTVNLLERLDLTLKDGSHLILNEAALKRCVFIIREC